jgi:two-component system, OmpR family, copper resistance phosphate regulon response regulator CusR
MERLMRILVVEDEPKVAAALQEGLEMESYSVTLSNNGEEGFFLASTEQYDLIVLDIMLPRRNGIEILSAMRQRGMQTPVLLLTARDAVQDRVLGLDSGADDYLAKPFAFPELSARIRALLRRGKAEDSSTLNAVDVQMDLMRRTVMRGTQAVELTAREFELLEYLLRHKGEVVSREMLARDVWKEAMRHTPLDNVIDVHIARLRRKIDEGFPKRLIHTVRGVGFILKSEES